MSSAINGKPHNDLQEEYSRRFSGLSRLYGVDGASSIRRSHVAVIGIGGVGSWAVEALVRSGVGHISLIDLDHIAESNVNRQVHALSATLGQAKIEAMRDRIGEINPHCHVNCVDDFVTRENWPLILPEGVDSVIDACDQVGAKVAMAAWALSQRKILYVAVGAAGGKRGAQQVEITDLSETSHDPLMAKVRYQLRKFHGAERTGRKIGITCVFSREAVRGPDLSCNTQGDGSLNCHGYGSSVAVTATFGFCAAGYILENLSNSSKK